MSDHWELEADHLGYPAPEYLKLTRHVSAFYEPPEPLDDPDAIPESQVSHRAARRREWASARARRAA